MRQKDVRGFQVSMPFLEWMSATALVRSQSFRGRYRSLACWGGPATVCMPDLTLWHDH